jgi:hypothetical protein|tara:strand:+ start:231 stop:500 length:270 start_codon:yes stop_codon:yes gene_type:complete
MKIFIYKTLIIFFLIFLLFKLTIGSVINNYEKKFDQLFSKEKLVKTKIKIKNEMKKAIEKENYLDPQDAKLINKFLKKLEKEIFTQNLQ